MVDDKLGAVVEGARRVALPLDAEVADFAASGKGREVVLEVVFRDVRLGLCATVLVASLLVFLVAVLLWRVGLVDVADARGRGDFWLVVDGDLDAA